MFKRLKSKFSKPVTHTAPEFIEARSYSGTTFHIVKTSTGEVLCGYKHSLPTNSVLPVDADKVLTSIPNQHEGWRWCAECGSILTGEPVERFKH